MRVCGGVRPTSVLFSFAASSADGAWSGAPNLLWISSELINSSGRYDWEDCSEALNPVQLIKS